MIESLILIITMIKSTWSILKKQQQKWNIMAKKCHTRNVHYCVLQWELN